LKHLAPKTFFFLFFLPSVKTKETTPFLGECDDLLERFYFEAKRIRQKKEKNRGRRLKKSSTQGKDPKKRPELERKPITGNSHDTRTRSVREDRLATEQCRQQVHDEAEKTRATYNEMHKTTHSNGIFHKDDQCQLCLENTSNRIKK
jgi:hypothetical protein